MKYLVTGGSGFIGTNLVHSLLKRKKEVIILDKVKPHSDVPFLNCDLSNLNKTNEVMGTLDKNEEYTIFHLAGLFEKDFKKRQLLTKKDYFDNNLLATKNLVNSLIRSKLNMPKFVFSSPALLNPEDRSKWAFGEDYYVESKHYAELELESLKNYCDSLHIARISRVIGKDNFYDIPMDIVSYFMNLLIEKDKVAITGANLKRNYVYISDVIGSLIKLKNDVPFSYSSIFSQEQVNLKFVANLVNERLVDSGILEKEREISFKESVGNQILSLDGKSTISDLQFKNSELVVKKAAKEYTSLLS
jgi:nucleoside-diphosphate-sugar epimerase